LNKKLVIASLALAPMLFASGGDMQAELDALKAQLQELKAKVEKQNVDGMREELSAVKKQANNDNLKFNVDYRFSYDNIEYKHADGTKTENDDLMTNRLLLGMGYAPRDDLAFVGQLSYNKAFGDSANHSQVNTAGGPATEPGYQNFDWVTNENATDNSVKVKQAYFIYFGNIADKVRYTASVGRRPSTGGLPTNLREGDEPQSPLGHGINVEFDGASFRFDLDKITTVSGMYFKICLGRGMTNAKPRFDMAGNDYAKDETKSGDIDLAGFIFVPYDNGQYKMLTSFYWAQNLIGFTQADMMAYQMASMGMDPTQSNPMTGQYVPANIDPAFSNFYQLAYAPSFHDVGNYHGGAITLMADGIGDFWSDFLDGTKVFLSYAYSVTQPKHGMSMLGSLDDKWGHSWYAGIQIPCLLNEGAKIGLEWNKGSKYWRSFTYAEDTMIGSKLAARGTAWEAYYLWPILDKTLTAELRYTQIDYDYTGSNSFFGDDGAPYTMDEAKMYGMNPVESARDLRFTMRYTY